MSSSMSRRQALSTVGAAGIGALLLGCGDDSDASSTPTSTTSAAGAGDSNAGNAGTGTSDLADQFDEAASCSLTPEEMEGPYYLDVALDRHDIREDRDGTPLRLGIRVLDESCEPVPNALVEVWHCDALGIYSGFEAASEAANAPDGDDSAVGSSETDDTTYLRGGQVTSADGIVEFTTVYPGWYQGRTAHIHTKVHLDSSELLTTQLYFDEDVTTAVYEQAPYDEHTGRDVLNSQDGLFLSETVVTITEDGDGYLALITYSIER